MCGIAGIFNTGGEPADREVLARMAHTIAYRGPDGEAFYFDVSLGLAHRHLRIIDLSEAALQPMCNEDRTVWLIFNGEVYNYVELRPELEAKGHRFKSHSDTEVIVHAYEEWGPDCLQRFNGMFAFALWDAPRQRLFLARDRMGVKPVYYWHQGSTFAFASEIKALLAHPDIQVRPHLPAVVEYVQAMYTTGEHTWFEGVKRLLPGHYMLVDASGAQVRQWWDVPAREDALDERPVKYYARKTRELLEDSVRLRLRSDVPLGAHLSGGLDSSAVVALLSRRLEAAGEPVRTFSGAFVEGPAYDERKYVKLVADRYSTDHRETIPTGQDLSALFDKIVWHMDEPAAGPGILLQWCVCELSRRSGVTVVNGGQGGDEAWGGYFGYVPAYVRTLLAQAKRHPSLYTELLEDAGKLLFRTQMRESALGALLRGRRGRLRPASGPGEWAGIAFMSSSGWMEAGIASGRDRADGTRRSPLAGAQYWDLKWYLPALLQVEDRTSMAFSLESRAPLLDYRLIEHSTTVPSALRMWGLEMKHILRRAVKDLLPPPVYQRTDKMGMPTPIDIWFRGPLAGWVRDQLLSESARSLGLFDEAYVRQAMNEHTSGKKDRSVDLWKMLSVTAWWRVFVARNGECGVRNGAD